VITPCCAGDTSIYKKSNNMKREVRDSPHPENTLAQVASFLRAALGQMASGALGREFESLRSRQPTSCLGFLSILSIKIRELVLLRRKGGKQQIA
jgi:hypothetical protein